MSEAQGPPPGEAKAVPLWLPVSLIYSNGGGRQRDKGPGLMIPQQYLCGITQRLLENRNNGVPRPSLGQTDFMVHPPYVKG